MTLFKVSVKVLPDLGVFNLQVVFKKLSFGKYRLRDSHHFQCARLLKMSSELRVCYDKTHRKAQGKRFTSFSMRSAFENEFSAYIFLRYWPPTSKRAWVICPNEQYLVTSISFSKVFPFFVATCCSSSSNREASFSFPF